MVASEPISTTPVIVPSAPGGCASPEELLVLFKGLVEVSTLINAITNFGELLTQVMDIARRVMRAEGCALILHNEKADHLELVVARSADGEVVLAHQPIPRQGSVAGWVFDHGKSQRVDDAYDDPRFFRGIDQKTGVRTRALLCVPLCRSGQPIGVLQVVNPQGEHRAAFNAADQEALEAFANLAATAIEKLRFMEDEGRRVRFEQELSIAKEIQESFLPANLPKHPQLTFAARYRPARAVGGDFYDLFEMGPDEIYFVIGDVAGKGIPAALLMAQSLSVLRLIIVPGIAPADALARWNRTLCRRSLRGLFVTATLGRIVPSRREVETASAGHLAPWLLHASKHGAEAVSEVGLETGPPLAVVPDAHYRSTFLTPLSGDCLVFCTDGLIDSTQAGTDVRLGTEGARRMLEKAFASPQAVVATLLSGEAGYRGETPPQDDLTLLAFGFRD